MGAYEKLIYLKYRQGVSTFRLTKQFPGQRKQIHEVALLGVPEKTLRKIVKEKRLLRKLLGLKKKFPLPRPAAKIRTSWLARLRKGFGDWL